MHLRSLKRVRGEVSLYDPIGVDREGNEITLVGVPKQTAPCEAHWGSLYTVRDVATP